VGGLLVLERSVRRVGECKGLLNGPCGGTNTDGKCELDPARDCAWVMIYKRMEKLGQLSELEEIV